ncbi:MAG TPA: carboxypeptidase-like regulatory domain-containing protein, partial [Patescibacteria group bacterium]|nr:carboxypeptidase-like regulatory domain-containing protein [Patescibacteria group bacterium]
PQTVYQSDFVVPIVGATYTLRLATIYQDNTISDQYWQINIPSEGLIHSDQAGNRPIASAQVSLLDNQYLLAGYGTTNPQVTGDNGVYGFMIPNGEYTLKVVKDGFLTYEQTISTANNIINTQIRLERDLGLGEVISVIKLVLDNPIIEQTNQIVAPAIVAISLVNAAIAIPWWNFIYYLQLLFTEPLAWLFRKRKKGWGIVYNSITKKPIDLAVVRLYDRDTKKLVKSRVTDKEGRYHFLVEEGNYYLEVVKSKFVFPSDLLKKVSHDQKYFDLYYGETIEIKQGQSGIITANIPIDQDEVTDSDREILKKFFWRQIREKIGIVGPIFALISFVVSPSLLMGLFVLLHVLLFMLFSRLAKTKRPKNWGVVFDKNTKSPLAKSVARIYAPEYNRMLEAQVTDRYGRYGFLAEGEAYYLTADKDGYKRHKTVIMEKGKEDVDELVARDMSLEQDVNEPVKPIIEQPSTIRSENAPISKEASPLEEMAKKIKETVEETSGEIKVDDDQLLSFTSAESVIDTNDANDNVSNANKEHPDQAGKNQAITPNKTGDKAINPSPTENKFG